MWIGGVRGGTQESAFEAIAEKIRANTAQVLEGAKRDRILTRQAAMNLGLRRVRSAMRYRRSS
jgi:glutamate dehydrogenase (NAD(P)+)